MNAVRHPMWTLPAALLLAGSYTAAKLSLTDTIKAVKESICKAGDGNELCINPEGPLNLLRAHALVGNSIVAKKRLFAAPGAIAYRLVYDEKKTLFEYKKRPEDGPIREFPSADPDAMAYLRAYYGVLRIMFRAVDMKVYVSNGHYRSFYKYLSVLPDDDKRAHFLAALLVLAEAGPAPSRPPSTGRTPRPMLITKGLPASNLPARKMAVPC
ncbi:hypothetical protein PAPHI01_1154 [Pancytospora philotis]|nr:hypothetical protein PAPHI01_1154 [Pancytospora philotis]